MNTLDYLNSVTAAPEAPLVQRVSIEEMLVVSNEGMLDTLKDIITGSRKGTEGRMPNERQDDKWAKLETLIKQTYANPAWLAKQRFREGEVDGSNIFPLLSHKLNMNPDPVAVCRAVLEYNKKAFMMWKQSIADYFKACAPHVAAMAKSKYTHEDYTKARNALTALGTLDEWSKNKPRVYPPTGRPCVEEHGTMRLERVPAGEGKLKALTAEQVKECAAIMTQNLDNQAKAYEDMWNQALAFYKTVATDAMIAAINKGDRKWLIFIASYKPGHVVFGFESWSAQVFAGDWVNFAVCRWIDRSIR